MEPKLLQASRFVDQEIGCSYRYVFGETERFRPHWHEYYEVFLMLEGTAIHKVNGASIHLSKGSLVFIRPQDCHDYALEEGTSCSFLNLTYSVETVESVFSFLGDGFPANALLNSKYPPEIRLTEYEFTRLNGKMDSVRALDPSDIQRRKTLLHILLFDILTRHFSNTEDIMDYVPAWLENMCSKIKQNGGFTQGTDYFLSLTDRSREHVSRCMKKYMGMTVSTYINDLRLNYIANMLRDSNHNVTEIIFESGFNNISWASEQFKNKYGVTMSQYRAGIRNTKNS